MPRNILITGGAGFVGRALVDRFASLGHKVTCVDVTEPVFRNDVTFHQLDIRDAGALTRICRGMDSVIHNAAIVHTRRSREKFVWDVNLGGTRNVLAACKDNVVPRLVYVSTATVVYTGEDIECGDESLPYSTVSQVPYADSKIAAEKLALAFDGVGATRTCAIRPHVVFGKDDHRFIAAILRKADSGKLRRVAGSEGKLWDFTYLSNLIDAIVAAEQRLVIGSPVCGQAYFVTNGEPMPFFDFVDGLISKMGYPAVKGTVPYWLAYTVACAVDALERCGINDGSDEGNASRFSVRYLARHHYFDIAKARRDFDWRPAVSLEEGVRLTVEALTSRSNELALPACRS